MTQPSKSTARALVTGASSGIGAAFAERLAHDGHSLVLVARRRERLEMLAERLHKQTGCDASVLAADLADPEGLAAVEARASKGDLSLLVNNAGFGGYRRFVELDPNTADALIWVHVLAATRLTRAALPGMVDRRQGGVINVASLLSLSGSLAPNPLPYRAVYAGAKAYLVTFTQTLAHELHGSGVAVQVCLPGVVVTEFHDGMALDRERLHAMGMSAPDVVQASLCALRTGEVVCIPGLDDPSLVDKLSEAQRAILASANRKAIANRYRT